MFAALNQIPGMGLPQFRTRKALIILNLQNDSLYHHNDLYITKNLDFVPRLKEMIPYFRTSGDVIWVRTEMGTIPSPPASDVTLVEEKAARLAEKNRKARTEEEAHLLDDTREKEAGRVQLPRIQPGQPYAQLPPYDPSSRAKKIMTIASAETRAEKRTANMQAFDDDDMFHERIMKPRKGQQASFFISGTRGAEICDELLDVIDEAKDLIVTKHHYSALDQTSLLMTLRMNLVTEVYLCGCLSNISVYATAADAVQHGLGVTVVEDCLGYRSEDKHLEAMRQMADIMGVNGIDSEEVIEEAGGRPVPDAETPGITLQELSLSAEEKADQASLVAESSNPQAGRKGSSASQVHDNEKSSDGKEREDAASRRDSLRSGASPAPPGSRRNRESWMLSKAKIVGPDDQIGSGDSRIIYDALSANVSQQAFGQVRKEVEWQTMLHRSGQVPRLVAAQGDIDEDGSEPIYRHPADESPPLEDFTPMVARIRKEVEKLLKQPFNHALIQLYRNGTDNISEHADKTLDIVRGSSIVNVSLGAQRAMTLRTKKQRISNGNDSSSVRQSQRIKMPHNSVFVLGPRTNREWLHGVRADKRPFQEKTEVELAYGGERISITFRLIGTFIHLEKQRIWGSGAERKTKSKAAKISNDSTQMEAMVNAFGRENHQPDFDWDVEYGSGFNVINLNNPQTQTKLILCKDAVANLRVRLSLEEKSIPYVVEAPSSETKSHYAPWTHNLANTENPVLVGLDPDGDTIEGDLAILIHLEKNYLPPTGEHHQYTSAQLFSCVAQANELHYLWHELRDSREEGSSSPTRRFVLEQERPVTPEASLKEELHATLKSWEKCLGESEYPFAGTYWSGIECAFWPVFNSIVSEEELEPETYPNLLEFHRQAMKKDSVKRLTRSEKGREI